MDMILCYYYNIKLVMPYIYNVIQLVVLVGEGSCYEGGLDEDTIFASLYFLLWETMNGSERRYIIHVLKLPVLRERSNKG